MKYNIGFIIGLTMFLYSCSSDYDNYMDRFYDCQDEIKDKDENKYKSIGECLSNYDFQLARKYLGCYDGDVWFDNDGNVVGYYSKDWLGNVVSTVNPYGKEFERVVRAEITYLFKNGELKMAETVALESDHYQIYRSMLNSNFELAMQKLIRNGKIVRAKSIAVEEYELDKFFVILHEYVYENLEEILLDKNGNLIMLEYLSVIKPERNYDLKKASDFYPNTDYIENVRYYHYTIIDKILNKMLLTGTKGKEIEKFIDMACLPEVEFLTPSTGRFYDTKLEHYLYKNEGTSQLVNRFKNEAIDKYLK